MARVGLVQNRPNGPCAVDGSIDLDRAIGRSFSAIGSDRRLVAEGFPVGQGDLDEARIDLHRVAVAAGPHDALMVGAIGRVSTQSL
jgi:hypothetical protein